MAPKTALIGSLLIFRQFLFLLITPILFSQTKTLKSNLEGLVLEIGDTFLPQTVIVNSNGKETACQTVIYYNKKGVFNVGGSIVQDPVSGKIIANDIIGSIGWVF